MPDEPVPDEPVPDDPLPDELPEDDEPPEDPVAPLEADPPVDEVPLDAAVVTAVVAAPATMVLPMAVPTPNPAVTTAADTSSRGRRPSRSTRDMGISSLWSGKAAGGAADPPCGVNLSPTQDPPGKVLSITTGDAD